MSTILITGGTGLLGVALTRLLVEAGHRVSILTRDQGVKSDAGIRYFSWDVKSQAADPEAFADAEYIIHLAGAGVAEKRWTRDRKKEIVDSRTLSSALLVKSLGEYANKVKAVVSASAIGYYGDDAKRLRKRKAFTEEMRPDKEFLGETCRLWEESIDPVTLSGSRLVKLRIGIVLSNRGGALPEFKKPLKFGIAGVLGSGQQVVSWIHIQDICRLFLFAIENEQLEGVFNAVAPEPARNKDLILLLAEKVKGRFFVDMHVPSFALKLLLGEMSTEVLKSATVSSEKIRTAGFSYLYPTLEEALEDLIKINRNN